MNIIIEYIQNNIILCNLLLILTVAVFFQIREILNKQNPFEYYIKGDLGKWSIEEFYILSYYLIYLKSDELSGNHMIIGLSKKLNKEVHEIDLITSIMVDEMKNYKGENIQAKQCYLFMEFLGKKRAKKLMKKSLNLILS